MLKFLQNNDDNIAVIKRIIDCTKSFVKPNNDKVKHYPVKNGI